VAGSAGARARLRECASGSVAASGNESAKRSWHAEKAAGALSAARLCVGLRARGGLDRGPHGLGPVLVVLTLGDRRGWLGTLALVQQVTELLVEAILVATGAALPPVVTHGHHLQLDRVIR